MHIEMFVGAAPLGAPLAPPPHPPDRVIAVDGGISLLPDGLDADLLIGDLDSIPADLDLDQLPVATRVERLPREKDVTDFEAALTLVLADEPDSIHVVNGAGDRIDHLVTVLAMLEHIPAQVLVTAQLGSAHTWRLTPDAPFTSSCEIDTIVSVVPCADGASGISTAGLRWPLNNEALLHGSGRGMSNEVIDEFVQISVTDGAAFVIISNAPEGINS